ncbi:Splicing factor 3A subunit 3 [Astathelohania contejeani]|uniref:Splicing factor 3A subunit 3 n=1 Tax=Astathelohania contejeani TaxID=164912 RepID=A0ABQ7HZL2_9MICR|nr:Splicing factor 3A subunit 3 [Thelohania contejeani]
MHELAQKFIKYFVLFDNAEMNYNKYKTIKKAPINTKKEKIIKHNILYRTIKEFKHSKKEKLRLESELMQECKKYPQIDNQILMEIFDKGIITNEKLPIKILFSKKEDYGRRLDMSFICQEYGISFEDMIRFNCPRADFKYYTMLKEIRFYLHGFIKRTKPFFKRWKVPQVIKPKPIDEQTKEFFESNYYCINCKQSINKKVYKFHIEGKRHKKKKLANESSINEVITKKDGEIINIFETEVEIIIIDNHTLSYKIKKSVNYNKIIELEKIILWYYKVLKEEIKYTLLCEDVNGVRQQQYISKRDVSKNEEVLVDEHGNSIPRWLYKYYGLDVEYDCEICGMKKYKGRSAFEAHFNEYTHVSKLKSMGINEYKRYFGIRTIKGVQRLKKRFINEEFIEEVEDKDGNVYDIKTYNDLKKHGLV